MFSAVHESSMMPLTKARMEIVQRKALRFWTMKAATLTTISSTGVMPPTTGMIQGRTSCQPVRLSRTGGGSGGRPARLRRSMGIEYGAVARRGAAASGACPRAARCHRGLDEGGEDVAAAALDERARGLVEVGLAVVDDDQPGTAAGGGEGHPGGGPDRERGADREADVAALGHLHGAVDVGLDERLAEADGRRLQQPPAVLAVGVVVALADPVEDHVDRHPDAAVEAPGPAGGAVELDDVGRARLL